MLLWIGVPELSSLSEHLVRWHGLVVKCLLFIPIASKTPWSRRRDQLWKKENDLWLSIIHLFPFSLISVFLSSCMSLLHTHHRHHTCSQRYTQTLNRHYAHIYHAHTHADTHRHHTHMHTYAMDIYKDTTHRYHRDTHTWHQGHSHTRCIHHSQAHMHT